MNRLILLLITLLIHANVFAQPVINNFVPASGPVGTTVTISGTGFSDTAANTIVYFGAVKATVVGGSSTQLEVKVPVGATYQPLSVTTNHLTAYSSAPFVVTFPSDSSAITSGSFKPAGNFNTGDYPSDIAMSDVDGDGKPDLVVADRLSNNFSILLNSSTIGNVAFLPKVDFYAGSDPRRIALADLNGDGRPDFITLNFNSGNASTVTVLSNAIAGGTIGFGSSLSLPAGNGALGLCIADMNGDGRPDIIISSGNSGTFTIFPNTTNFGGTISFGPELDYPNLRHGDYITAVDMDNDGKPDLITANFSGNTISVYRNIGTGGNFALASNIDYATGANPTYVTAGDLDGDGKPDLVVGNYSANTISLFKNNSTTGNISLAARQDSALSTTMASFADLNGDGLIDLSFGNNLTGKISVLQNNYSGTGPISLAPSVDFMPGNYDTYVFSGDLDGDGKSDLAVANPGLNSVAILRNTIGDPVITALSADTGFKGTLITLTGRNFTGTVSVAFGGMPADSFHLVSPTRIDAVVGAGASGDVSVTTLYGMAGIAGFIFIPEIRAGGATTFCRGGSVLLTATSATNNQWFRNGVALTGDTANTLLVDSGGNYTVQTTSNGITTTSAGLMVTVKTVPTPVIAKEAHGNLVSGNATGNQWYYYESILPGDTSRIYRPTQPGAYRVTCTQDGCTSDFSACYFWRLSGVIDLSDDQFIRYYPNPVVNRLFVSQQVKNEPLLLDISVTDHQGKLLRSIQNVTMAEIDFSQFPVGIYYLKIYSNGKYKVNKTVKILKVL